MALSVNPPERQLAMRLRGGRILSWSEWGPACGRPVLFCTGAAMSSWLGFGESCLGELGIRLAAIDRPGLGASDPHPGKTLRTWVDDTRDWMSFNRIRELAVVGFSQGAPFALALAGDSPVRAVAIVSGQDEFGHPSIAPMLEPDVAAMVREIQTDETEFEDRFTGAATYEGLLELVLRMSGPRDLCVYRDGRFLAAYKRSLREGFAQGAHGYVRDLVNAMREWTLPPEEIAVPVHLWYGRADRSPVHSPDFGQTMASRLRRSTLTVDPEEGGSILWTRSGDILDHLLQAV